MNFQQETVWWLASWWLSKTLHLTAANFKMKQYTSETTSTSQLAPRWEHWDATQQLETVTCPDMCCGSTTWTKRRIVFFRHSSFRLPGMASQPSFSFLISQIKLPLHLTHQQIWLLQLTNYQKNTSGMCHRRRATQHRRPQRAQISLETPCPLFFFFFVFLCHRGRLSSLRLQEQGCWSFSILLSLSLPLSVFLSPSTKNVNATFSVHFAWLPSIDS